MKSRNNFWVIPVVLVTLFFTLCSSCSEENNRSTIAVTASEFTNLITAYETNHPGETWGGMISKVELLGMITALPSGDAFVNFRFYTDPLFHKTSLMLCGSRRSYESGEATICLRNGGSDEAYCPSNCAFVSSGPMASSGPRMTVLLDFVTLDNLATDFQTANPGMTWGGRIDKGAFLDLINDIPSGEEFVKFRFCTDPECGKTSVIFIGGAEGTASSLYMRNGNDPDSYCPTNCDYR